MSELTSETLDTWRKDAERVKCQPPEYHADADRMLALLDALAAEKAAREEATRNAEGWRKKWHEDTDRFEDALEAEEARAIRAEESRDAYKADWERVSDHYREMVEKYEEQRERSDYWKGLAHKALTSGTEKP